MKNTLTLLSILALTFTFAQAEMKCAAGKCGASMTKKVKEAKPEASKCGNATKEMKCAAGKCGADMKKEMPAEVKGKCGKGKCGGN